MQGIGIDWGAAWKAEQASRRLADDSSYWDKRAPSFQKTAGTSPYARTFIERAALEPGWTVFDMGCGSGTLALPLARDGHEVWAADFSPVMLELMMRRAEEDGVDGLIHPVELAWDADWLDAGVPVCDVAFASRSAATSDLQRAMAKLAGKASKRVCLTLGTNDSPRSDDVLTKAIGRRPLELPDFVFAMNMLWDEGIYAELSFISSKRADVFENPRQAVEKFALIYNATEEERRRLELYAAEHLAEVETPEGPRWKFDHERTTRWAFISWDKQGA